MLLNPSCMVRSRPQSRQHSSSCPELTELMQRRISSPVKSARPSTYSWYGSGRHSSPCRRRRVQAISYVYRPSATCTGHELRVQAMSYVYRPELRVQAMSYVYRPSAARVHCILGHQRQSAVCVLTGGSEFSIHVSTPLSTLGEGKGPDILGEGDRTGVISGRTTHGWAGHGSHPPHWYPGLTAAAERPEAASQLHRSAPDPLRSAHGPLRPAPGPLRPAPGPLRPAPGPLRPAPGSLFGLGRSDAAAPGRS